jgi:hypothetical protein
LTNENGETFWLDCSLKYATESEEFGIMMEDIRSLKSPLFDVFENENHVGPMICKVIKATEWRPVLIAALITILKDNNTAKLLQLEDNLSNKNSWLLNYWLKSANLLTMDLITSLK